MLEKAINILLDSGLSGAIMYMIYRTARPLLNQCMATIKQIGETNRLQAKSIDRLADSIEHLSESKSHIVKRIDEAEDNIIQQIKETSS